MTHIPDFDDYEIGVVQTTVNARYGKNVELQLADSEVRPDPGSEELAWCPTIFWTERGANFVLIKTGPGKYRSIFYYQPNQQYGTGHDAYDDLGACVTSLLQVQADHEKDMAGATPGKTGGELK